MYAHCNRYTISLHSISTYPVTAMELNIPNNYFTHVVLIYNWSLHGHMQVVNTVNASVVNTPPHPGLPPWRPPWG